MSSQPTNTPAELVLYRERPGWIGVPRHYEAARELEGVVDMRRLKGRSGPDVDIVFRDSIQEEACDALLADDNDKIISLGCGRGKTAVSIAAMAAGDRYPALVVVNTNQLAQQWKANVNEDGVLVGGIAKFLGIPEKKIGHIQGDVERWRGCDVAVAMLHTLVKRKFSRAFYNYWRLVIFDEWHRLAAGWFLPVASKFPCERWGLSATTKREDRLDRVLKLHTGKVVYTNVEQPLKAHTVFHRTPFKYDMSKYIMRNGRLNVGRMYTHVAESEGRNDYVLRHIIRHYRDGRTILVLGERRTQLHWFHEKLQALGMDSALCLGGGSKKAKLAQTEALRHRVVLGTQQIAKEGLDRPAFDTLCIPIPFGQFGRLRQTIGRILREVSGKRDPVVDVFIDPNPVMRSLERKMRTGLDRMKFKYTVKEAA